MTQYSNIDLLLIPQVMKNFEVSNMNALNEVSVELEVLKGMPGKKDCTPESVIIHDDEVSSIALDVQVNDKEVLTIPECVSNPELTEEVSSKETVSTPALKRKYSDEIETNGNYISNEVSTCPKRARVTNSSDKGECDHSCCIKSPSRVRRQVDNLKNKVKSLQKRLKSSQQKTRRRNKKVSTLASVVSELKEKNLINNDCATMLENNFFWSS